ncbi:helix-turn-helix transcriptional regulator [bacterium]|nr:helix-turn-helix transcriptional regulator [bacterium]
MLFGTLLTSTTIILFLFVVFLWTEKRGNKVGNRLFAGFLFAHVLSNTFYILFLFDLEGCVPFLRYFGFAPEFTYGPFLYLYIMITTYRISGFHRKHLFHFILFILAFIYILFRFHLCHGDETIRAIRSGWRPLDIRFFIYLITFQYIIYAVLAIIRVHQYRQELNRYYSAINRIHFSWLYFISYSFLFLRIIGYIQLFDFHLSISVIQILFIIYFLASLVMAMVVMFWGLRHPQLFVGWEEKQKYKQSPEFQADKAMVQSKLITYMDSEKPYLNPLLTLEELSRKAGIPGRYISQVINGELNQNFFDFINTYRIREAQRLLKEKKTEKRTVLEILYEAGFNSKSVFHIAFKKYTGMTPTEYIQKNAD